MVVPMAALTVETTTVLATQVTTAMAVTLAMLAITAMVVTPAMADGEHPKTR